MNVVLIFCRTVEDSFLYIWRILLFF